ncbi:CvpA family protein [Desulfosarcina ovata]|uniref:Colicin V biosynthesis protein n=2 Tax=Desulfosarcina ovata TaxID=83564 RepID=A0A5K8A5U6_9BACT|nr:CvpA family protein [Desulfosarcina ovata]BBO80620.1 colicin V biosynthesis protein [Desulfosarcina ovata subsp. sediminis]BBO87831.1 colicin V biosynthesis protein [Desulfosarcina ovata subsp. ovata]
MNPFDILIITILAYGLIRGIFRGLVRELSSIVGVLGGFYAAYTYYPHVARLIAPWISDRVYLNILSYLLIFSAVVIIVGVLAVVIKYLLNIAYLGWVDRISGALFGVFKGALVICVLFIVLTAFLPKGAPLLKQATLSPYVATVSEIMAKVLSKDMKENFIIKIKELKKSWPTP